MKLDQKNKNILNELQKSSKSSNQDISDTLGIPTTTVFERIRKLEKEGVVKGYKALIDAEKVGYGFTAFVFVRSKTVNFDQDIVDNLRKIPFVLEIHEVAGDYSYLVKVCAKDHIHLSDILKEYFSKLPEIRSTNSFIALRTHLDNGSLPI